ncbi:MAG TPA: PAS domain-containing protein [Stellaceae bacterium]|nr:PAS domain-containing protein [Stellaceae bacterium]
MPGSPIPHPVLGSLLRYWQVKRGTRALPSRRDIDPLEMGPDLLPHLLLADLLDRGTRVRFRLVGTSVVKRIGFDPTGRYLDGEMSGGWWELLASLHRLVYSERAPVYAESQFVWGSGRRMRAQHLLLPLVQDGTDPAIALGGIAFASDEVFPPTIRALGPHAVHEEGRRLVLKQLPRLESACALSRGAA